MRWLVIHWRCRPDQAAAPARFGLLRAVAPDDPWNKPPAWRALLPHVLAATDTRRIPDPAGDDVAGFLDLAGLYLLNSAHNLAATLPALGHAEQASELGEWVRSRR